MTEQTYVLSQAHSRGFYWTNHPNFVYQFGEGDPGTRNLSSYNEVNYGFSVRMVKYHN